MNFSEAEKKIIEARQTGLSICDQNEKQLAVSLTGIIFKISVISGCPLPTHDAHIAALESEFLIFLNDNGYSGLTPEEVLTAFRMNANFKLPEKIETYNKVFNIDFAAEVLSQYRKIRSEVDVKAEKIFDGRDVKRKLEEDDNRRRLKVKEQFAKYISNPAAELDLSDCFMQLRYDGAFANKTVTDEISYMRGTNSIERLLNSFESLDKKFLREQAAVKYLFENMAATGRKEIYDENLVLLHPGFELPERFETEKVKDNFDGA